MFETLSVPELFFVTRSVNFVNNFSIIEILIRDNGFSVGGDGISPEIADTIRELFLLSPEDFGR